MHARLSIIAGGRDQHAFTGCEPGGSTEGELRSTGEKASSTRICTKSIHIFFCTAVDVSEINPDCRNNKISVRSCSERIV